MFKIRNGRSEDARRHGVNGVVGTSPLLHFDIIREGQRHLLSNCSLTGSWIWGKKFNDLIGYYLGEYL